jgi:hypothetical protein
MRAKRPLIVFLLAASIAGLAFYACGEMATRIPRKNQTTSAMTETMVRMRIYLQHSQTLPDSLDVLPVRKGYLNCTTDGWGRPLIYVTEDKGFTLTSLGKDGVPGGSGEDADVVRKYSLVNGDLEEILP